MFVDDNDSNTYRKGFYSIKISNLALYEVTRNSEAFATLIVHYDLPSVQGPLWLKVDTGSGETLFHIEHTGRCLVTYRQHKYLAQRKLCGHPIPCMGSINLGLQRSNSAYIKKHKFYVVDVPGPAIIGLQSCQDLKLIFLDDDLVNSVSSSQGTAPGDKQMVHKVQEVNLVTGISTPPPDTKINSIGNLKWWFPDRFDCIGCFKGKAKIHL